jgi:hypothetical protein
VIDIIGTSNPAPAKALDLSGGSIQNPGGVPGNLQILYMGTSAVALSGGSGSYGVVYAPNAPIAFSGTSPWYGAVIENTVNDSGEAAVDYDRALSQSLVQVGSYYGMSFSWSEY